jgi:hypothetical protein
MFVITLLYMKGSSHEILMDAAAPRLISDTVLKQPKRFFENTLQTFG